jgi:MoaA/NifB/PqqE/SkfB family radical SAM enzyme
MGLKAVEFITNGVLWTPEVWAKIPGVHGLLRYACISVDAATRETWKAVKRRDLWDHLQSNLRFVAGLKCPMALSFVLQSCNWRELPAFVDLAKGYGFKVRVSMMQSYGCSEATTGEAYRKDMSFMPWGPDHEEFLGILRQLKDVEGVQWYSEIHNMVQGLRQERKG